MSLIEGAECKGSILDLDKDKKIEAETLQVKFENYEATSGFKGQESTWNAWGKLASLLDSGSMVSLVQQSYFDWNIKPKLEPARGLEVSLHNLFDLKGAKWR